MGLYLSNISLKLNISKQKKEHLIVGTYTYMYHDKNSCPQLFKVVTEFPKAWSTIIIIYYYFAHYRKSFWQRFLRRNKRWKIRIRQVVKHQAFYWTVLICVFLNTVITALQHYNQPDWLTQFQGDSDVVPPKFSSFLVICFLMNFFRD